jgi:hypothetical protein
MMPGTFLTFPTFLTQGCLDNGCADEPTSSHLRSGLSATAWTIRERGRSAMTDRDKSQQRRR